MIRENVFLMAFNSTEDGKVKRYFMCPQECNNGIQIVAIDKLDTMENFHAEYPLKVLWRYKPVKDSKGVFTGNYSIVNEYYRDCVLVASGNGVGLTLKRPEDLQCHENQYWLTLALNNQSEFTVYTHNKFDVNEQSEALLIRHNDTEITSSAYNPAYANAQNWALLPKHSLFKLVYEGLPGQDALLHMSNGLATRNLYISGYKKSGDPEYTGIEESLISITSGKHFSGEVRFVGQIKSSEEVWAEIRTNVHNNLAREGYAPEEQKVIAEYIQKQLQAADPGNPDFNQNNAVPLLWLNPGQKSLVDALFAIRLLEACEIEIIFSVNELDNTPGELEIPFYILVEINENNRGWHYKVLDPTGVIKRLPR